MSGADIALLRHFPTDWNGEGRIQGRIDRELTDAARNALSRFAPPAPWDAARVVASPLVRAAETARRLWPDCGLDARLVEMDWGSWEGRRGVDLLADPTSGYGPVETWGWDGGPPDGESPRAVWGRVAPLLGEIARTGVRHVLVAHRGLMRVILARACGWDFASPEPFAIKRARLYPLRLRPDGEPVAPLSPVRLAAR